MLQDLLARYEKNLLETLTDPVATIFVMITVKILSAHGTDEEYLDKDVHNYIKVISYACICDLLTFKPSVLHANYLLHFNRSLAVHFLFVAKFVNSWLVDKLISLLHVVPLLCHFWDLTCHSCKSKTLQ